MACVTIPVDSSFKERLALFPWINWSEIAREEAMKKEIFEDFIKRGELSEEYQEFCDEIDWYPVDELKLKEEFIAELKKIEKGPHKKMSLAQLDKLLGLK